MKVAMGTPVTFPAILKEKSVTKGDFSVSVFVCKNDDNVPEMGISTKEISFKAVGVYQPPRCAGAKVEMTGEWVNSTFKSRGKTRTEIQFNVRYMYPVLPDTEDETVMFLRGVSGIGRKTAVDIVTKFHTVEAALKDKTVLMASIKGLSERKVKELTDAVNMASAVRDMVKLLGHAGISASTIGKVAEKYGVDSMKVVQQQPYSLLRTLSFDECDRIAIAQNLDMSSPERTQAAVLASVLSIRSQHMSIIADINETVHSALERCNANDGGIITEADIQAAVKHMVKGDDRVLANTKQYLYLAEDYDAEVGLAQTIATLSKTNGAKDDVARYWAAFHEWKDKNHGIKLSQEQELAVQSAANVLSVVTGGPGTGKTTVLKAIIETYKMAFPYSPVTLIAPTGLAAKRMTESCGQPATTIHKAFHLKPAETVSGFSVQDSDKKIQGGLVICDEFSMVPLHLANFVFSGIPVREDTRIVCVGDIDQLPPVQPGAVLDAIISSDAVKVTRLLKNFRQESGSSIIDLAYAINEGREEDVLHMLTTANNANDLRLIKVKENDIVKTNEILEDVVHEFKSHCEQHGKDSVFIVSATHVRSTLHPEYPLYSNNINTETQDVMNPRKGGQVITSGTREFRIGDRVVNLKNNDKVINGDIGTVVQIDQQNSTMTVQFDDVSVTYEQKDIKDVELANCITVHKSQGSEFGYVIFPCSRTQPNLTRKLLYTAVTRAKTAITFIGDPEVIAKAAMKSEKKEKRDFLAARIAKATR